MGFNKYLLISIGLLFAFFLFSNTANASVLRKAPNNLGLVGYWSFEDATGTLATDFSGNGNIGTLNAGGAKPTWASGKVGSALSFDGSDYVTVTDTGSNVEVGSALTITAWVKPNASVSNINIVSRANFSYRFRLDGGNTLWAYLNGSVAAATTSSFTTTSDIWQHVAMVYDGVSNTVVFYLNGASDSKATSVSGVLDSPAQDLFIGSYTQGAEFFSGLIDEVRIYNRALSATEVADLYARSAISKINSSQKNFLTDGLVGYWSFDGNDISGTVAYDRAGTNNGTITGAVSTIGRLGQALSFDGSGDRINLDTNRYAINVESLSISFWEKTISSAGNVAVYSQGNSGSTNPVVVFGNYTMYPNAMSLSFRSDANSGNFEGISDSSTVYRDGEWHHFVGTRSGDDVVLYRDGSQVASTTLVGQGTGTTTLNKQTIGALGRSSYNFDWPGLIDEVRVYNRALSPTEVEVLYNAGSTKFNVSPKTSLTDGLVGYWTFDGADLTTTTSTDVSGNGNDGTLVGGVKPVIGRLGQALSFDGVNDYVIDAGGGASLDISTGTVGAWIKTTSAGSLYRGIASKQRAYGMFLKDNVFGIYDWGGVAWRSTDTALNDGIWHHVLFSFQSGVGSGTKLYIDGGLATTTTMSVSDQDVDFQIGWSNASNQYFNGSIDEVRVYDRVLSPTEVLQLYNMGK